MRPYWGADDETVAHLGHNERALDPAVVVDRGLVASRDRFGDQRPQAVVAFADRVLRQRMSTRLHAVGDACSRQFFWDEHNGFIASMTRVAMAMKSWLSAFMVCAEGFIH